MTYHPREIMTTALFLANKTENRHYSLKTFAEKLAEIPGLDKITADEIVAPEFILTQGLRFCFDVRHPHRALKGLLLELQQLAQLAAGGPQQGAVGELRERLRSEHGGDAKRLAARSEKAYQAAREVLQRPAMLSDAYFLFTPAQIALAALAVADAPLVEGLLSAKFSLLPPTTAAADDEERRPTLERVLAEVGRCASALKEVRFDDAQLKREAVAVDRKLHFCRNPEKLDLVGLNRARKRDAGEDGGKAEEDKLAKKRRLEKERREREEDPFGPSLAA
jgi:cyclin H